MRVVESVTHRLCVWPLNNDLRADMVTKLIRTHLVFGISDAELCAPRSLPTLLLSSDRPSVLKSECGLYSESTSDSVAAAVATAATTAAAAAATAAAVAAATAATTAAAAVATAAAAATASAIAAAAAEFLRCRSK